MPELPEVETIIRRLKNGSDDVPALPGQVISSVTVTWDLIVAAPDVTTFRNLLPGNHILDACRRGKYLHFPLSHGHLIGHLRMSGDMRIEPGLDETSKPLPLNAYDRVIINFESQFRLVFSSIRKFGRMWAVSDPDQVLGSLGPEPLSQAFTSERLYEMLQTHARQVKPLLLDQTFIAGLGNIYTDEALFRAQIHPLRKSDSLVLAEAQRLHHAIQQVLTAGIQRFGASLDWIYRGGQFQNDFNVYGQTSNPCKTCTTPIVKIKVGQRGTHFCPGCQPLHELDSTH